MIQSQTVLASLVPISTLQKHVKPKRSKAPNKANLKKTTATSQQNRRTIASVQSGEYFEIPTSELGVGSTTLQAVILQPQNQTVMSKPVPVSLVAPNRFQNLSTKFSAAKWISN